MNGLTRISRSSASVTIPSASPTSPPHCAVMVVEPGAWPIATPGIQRPPATDMIVRSSLLQTASSLTSSRVPSEKIAVAKKRT